MDKKKNKNQKLREEQKNVSLAIMTYCMSFFKKLLVVINIYVIYTCIYVFGM